MIVKMFKCYTLEELTTHSKLLHRTLEYKIIHLQLEDVFPAAVVSHKLLIQFLPNAGTCVNILTGLTFQSLMHDFSQWAYFFKKKIIQVRFKIVIVNVNKPRVH